MASVAALFKRARDYLEKIDGKHRWKTFEIFVSVILKMVFPGVEYV